MKFCSPNVPMLPPHLLPGIAVPFQVKDPMEITRMLYHSGRASREHQADPINSERSQSKDPACAAVGLGDGDHIKSQLGQGKPKAFSYCRLGGHYFIPFKYHETKKRAKRDSTFLQVLRSRGISGGTCCLEGLCPRQGLKAKQGQSPLAKDRVMGVTGRE